MFAPIRTGFDTLRADIQRQYQEMKVNHIATFIKDNWTNLTAYLVAWSLIILIMGGRYGFPRVGKPLTIGIAVGVAGSLGVSFLSKGIFHDKTKSGWQLFRNYVLRPIDKGTSSLLISVIIMLMLTLIPKFPRGIGIFMGGGMGNHLFTQILIGDKMEEDKTDRQLIEDLQRQNAKQSSRIKQLEHQRTVQNQRRAAQLREMANELAPPLGEKVE